MSIFYNESARTFFLSGGDVSYVLHIDPNGFLTNLYWGKRVPDDAIRPELDNYPSGASFDQRIARQPLELPVRGSGWYGTPAVSAINAHGDDVVDLRYVSHEIFAGKKPLAGLPATYVESDDEAASVEIELADPLTGLRVTAVYSVYDASGVVTRSVRMRNDGAAAMTIDHAQSASVLLYSNDYDVIHLKGGWARERDVVRTDVGKGEYRIFSQRGAGSSLRYYVSVAHCDHIAAVAKRLIGVVG